MEETFPFSCPVCARTTGVPVGELKEGAVVTCPFCKLKLKLHGHMWQYVQRELRKMGAEPGPPEKE